MSKKDDTGQITSDNIKKINFDQMNRESRTLNYNYELIMLLHNKSKDDIDTRLDRAFRYENGSEEKEECYKIFEEYVLGGIEVLQEKLLNNATNIDEYIYNISNFISEYNERYNDNNLESNILDLCS